MHTDINTDSNTNNNTNNNLNELDITEYLVVDNNINKDSNNNDENIIETINYEDIDFGNKIKDLKYVKKRDFFY